MNLFVTLAVIALISIMAYTAEAITAQECKEKGIVSPSCTTCENMKSIPGNFYANCIMCCTANVAYPKAVLQYDPSTADSKTLDVAKLLKEFHIEEDLVAGSVTTLRLYTDMFTGSSPAATLNVWSVFETPTDVKWYVMSNVLITE